MMNPLRYAVYVAPPPESALWRFGSDVIGRDAASGQQRPGFAAAGFDAEAWRDMTSEPRRYGFHATIKAPFRLAEDASLSDLSAALAALAHANRPFAAGPLAVSALSLAEGAAFVALTPRAPSTEIAQLEERIVVGLDAFRAPLDESERARRDPSFRSALNASALEGELQRIKKSQSGTLSFADIITKSPSMHGVIRIAEKAARYLGLKPTEPLPPLNNVAAREANNFRDQ